MPNASHASSRNVHRTGALKLGSADEAADARVARPRFGCGTRGTWCGINSIYAEAQRPTRAWCDAASKFAGNVLCRWKSPVVFSTLPSLRSDTFWQPLQADHLRAVAEFARVRTAYAGGPKSCDFSYIETKTPL